MKVLITRALFVAFAALVVSPAARSLAETILFEYDFENLDTAKTTPNADENLIGQDADTLNPSGWIKSGSRWSAFPNYADKGLKVLQGTDADVNTSIVIKQTVGCSWGGAYQWRSISEMTFTDADTEIVQYAKIRDGSVGDTNPLGLALGGFEFSDLSVAPYAKMGIYSLGNMSQGQGLKAAWREANGAYHLSTELLVPGHWYEFKGVMDFSVSGGQIDLWYRDITADTDFVTEASLTDCPMGLTTADGTYRINALGIFSQKSNTYFDDYKLANAIPEPSTLALLACGLFGLLAYAWRKRK